jgi:general nucleoside transport system ATP-binding protein
VLGAGGRKLLDAVDLSLCAAEVVAIAGVSGNGQTALAELLCGERALSAGSCWVAGQALPARPRAFVEAGVARVPEDRHNVGLVGDLALWENLMLEQYRSPFYATLGFIQRRRAKAHAHELIQRFDVRGCEAEGVDTPARRLSGGNMQKLILARALTTGSAGGAGAGVQARGAVPPLIIANQPTWGLDIGAVAYVHQQLLDAAAAGSAVLVISEDLDEVFALADRIAVMHQGRLTAAWPSAQWSRAAIGLAMVGAAPAQDRAADCSSNVSPDSEPVPEPSPEDSAAVSAEKPKHRPADPGPSHVQT